MNANRHRWIMLSGFLGLESDWQPLKQQLLEFQEFQHDDWSAREHTRGAIKPFWDWAREFCGHITQQKLSSRQIPEKRVLLGYSLGGRLALHALLTQPELWSAAVILSSHPGLGNEDHRRQRLENDEVWAQRFAQEPWPEVMSKWNQQEVFRGSSAERASGDSLQRFERHYDRSTLSEILRVWSLGRQENLRPMMASLRVPTLWLWGEEDVRFDPLMRELRLELIDSPAHEFQGIPNAGHRLISQAPNAVAKAISEFLRTHHL